MKPDKTLGQYKAEQAERAAARIAQDDKAEVTLIAAWDRAMTRVFKGIFPRNYRHANLRAAQRRMDSTGSFAPPHPRKRHADRGPEQR